VGGGAVARDRLRAGGEQSGDDPTAVRDGPVADGVDAAVDREEAGRRDAVVDGLALEPECEQLRAADNPASTGGQPGDYPIDLVNVVRPAAPGRRHDVDPRYRGERRTPSPRSAASRR